MAFLFFFQLHRLMMTLRSVKKSTESIWPWRIPKNESLIPPNGNNAIGAGTPTFMPMFPARTLRRNFLAEYPFDVKMLAAFP